jgi:hypothetical protein
MSEEFLSRIATDCCECEFDDQIKAFSYSGSDGGFEQHHVWQRFQFLRAKLELDPNFGKSLGIQEY